MTKQKMGRGGKINKIVGEAHTSVPEHLRSPTPNNKIASPQKAGLVPRMRPLSLWQKKLTISQIYSQTTILLKLY